jgi:FtsZ-binding cell division protein ZapB
LSFGSHTVDDPASDESVNIGSIDGGTAADMFRIYTNDGNVDIGPKNTSWAHFYTDRPSFYFDRAITVDDNGTTSNLTGAQLASYDSDLILKRDYDDSTSTKIKLFSTTINYYVNGTAIEFQMQSDGDFHADGDVIAYSTTTSDRRLKKNFVELKPQDSLDRLFQLQGYEYEWKYRDDGVHYGVIAQDLMKVLPHAVKERTVPFYDGSMKNQDDNTQYKEEWKKENGVEDDKYYTARYEEIIPVIIEGMKALQEQIDELKKDSHEPQNYKAQCERMEKELDKLKQEVKELKNGYKNR